MFFPTFLGAVLEEVRTDMQVRYLAPIVEEDAVAEGWVTQRGRSLVFCDAEVRSASGTLAASATLVYKVSSRPQVLA